ncbi:MAG: hypothetical protein CUN55_06360 [Phototrophicales bacterium]|nr:MAG: hypothetical protein CUN55_06360 [Phototrophicales bacterium]
MMRLKIYAHQLLDPLLAIRKRHFYQQQLSHLSDGDYYVPYDIPYVSQFASPDKINDYIHNSYDGTTDPNWHLFGAPDATDYAFWCHRVCALACLKMCIQTLTEHSPTLWELVQHGLKYDGYKIYDEKGRMIDEGWYVSAQIQIANDYGLAMETYSYAPALAMCKPILDGYPIIVAVSPEIGERKPNWRRYGGHVVLVYGFEWRKGNLQSLYLHNPSGRYPELQAKAKIPQHRFQKLYAHRFSAVKLKASR